VKKEEYDMYCTSVSNPEAWHGMISIDRIVESKESATREDRTSQDIYIYLRHLDDPIHPLRDPERDEGEDEQAGRDCRVSTTQQPYQ